MKHTIFQVLMKVLIFGRGSWCAIPYGDNMMLEDEDVDLENDSSLESYEYSDKSFTIKTMGCFIPSANFKEESIKKVFVSKEHTKGCKHYKNRLLESNLTHIWIIKDNFKHYKMYNETNLICCYRSFHRPVPSRNLPLDEGDDRILYLPCINFKKFIRVNKEFVKVSCFYEDDDEHPVYEQYFVFTPKKPFTVFRDNPFTTPAYQLTYNVIVMGIDSMSRQNFHRTMSNTVELLKNYNAIELKGYSTVAGDTFGNMIPVLVGMNSSELRSTCWTSEQSTLDHCPFIWERFKDMGYYTALMEDTSRFSMFTQDTLGFRGSTTDYYVHPFIKQAEMLHEVNNVKPLKSCMGDKFYFEVLLKYVQDITTTLKGYKLFGVFWEASMTRANLNDAVIMDDEYFRLIKHMEATGYLNDTILIFMSDMGIEDFPLTKQSQIEQRLPLFFIQLPPSFQKQYSLAYQNLKLNVGRLTTPFDVHQTLLDIIEMSEITEKRIIQRTSEFYTHDRGISMFLQIPKNRTCEMAGISDTWCACNKEVPLPSNSPILQYAVKFITDQVNEMLKPYPECLKLIVDEIVVAKELVPVYVNTTEWRDFNLVVSMAPGGGLFVTMLRYYNKRWTILDNIRRLNYLGLQSVCVEDPVIKLLCHCKLMQ